MRLKNAVGGTDLIWQLLSAEQFSDAWVLFCFKLWLWDQFSQKPDILRIMTYTIKKSSFWTIIGPACQKGFTSPLRVSISVFLSSIRVCIFSCILDGRLVDGWAMNWLKHPLVTNPPRCLHLVRARQRGGKLSGSQIKLVKQVNLLNCAAAEDQNLEVWTWVWDETEPGGNL